MHFSLEYQLFPVQVKSPTHSSVIMRTDRKSTEPLSMKTIQGSISMAVYIEELNQQ